MYQFTLCCSRFLCPCTMFHLISYFFNSVFSKKEYSILIIGLDNAGKTTILENLKYIYNNTKIQNTIPTIGLNICRISTSNSVYRIWDLGGSESLIPLWKNYFNDANAIIFVIDSTDSDRLTANKETFNSH